MEATEVKLTKKDFSSDQDIRWCPGCGDYAILSQVQKIFPDLQNGQYRMTKFPVFLIFNLDHPARLSRFFHQEQPPLRKMIGKLFLCHH